MGFEAPITRTCFTNQDDGRSPGYLNMGCPLQIGEGTYSETIVA
ncbi:uncharacterized protein CLUP02_14978 [Colletotrichum lupini]|uniref:Uncharacterized protein n=1 Tax=Colletotrichum lupini TaxID=145971 RepID=A0A9Q8T741_9PEZI|nr:uncharacterized protein CLUP02_14978 [Colletotrichum lupini]UQC89447.1 hypothetical protein CLUP02_14978 [Colletotrichum lupini]